LLSLLYAIPNRIIYHSVYDEQVSLGNTSTGKLFVNWGEKSIKNTQKMQNTGVKIIPWGNLGDDLFGRIRCEQFKRFGLNTNYLKIIPSSKTPFLFILSQKKSENINLQYNLSIDHMLPFEFEEPIDMLFGERTFSKKADLLIDLAHINKRNLKKIALHDGILWGYNIDKMTRVASIISGIT
jgi:hypothetical protein